MALPLTPGKRAFADFSFLEDGVPMSAKDVPYHPQPITPRTVRRVSSPRNIATAQPAAVNRWGFGLSRALGAVNFVRPTILCLSNAATRTALFLLNTLPESARRYLRAPVNIIAVPTESGNKRRSVEVPSPRATPRVVSASRASPLNQYRVVSDSQSLGQHIAAPDSDRRISSLPNSILRRSRTRPQKNVNFNLSLNRQLSPLTPASPDLNDDLDQAMRDLEYVSTNTPLGSSTPPTMPVNEVQNVYSADEPPSIIPPPEVDEPESIVASHTNEHPLRLAAATRQESLSQSRLLAILEEDEWVAASRADRQESARKWRTRFFQIKKERDVERARLAEVETLAQLAGMSVQEFKLISSPITTPRQPTFVEGPTGITPTPAMTDADVDSTAARAMHTPTAHLDMPIGEPPTSVKSNQTVSVTPKIIEPPATTSDDDDDDDDEDPWLTLVGEEELAERTVTELADLSITVQRKLIEPLSQDWVSRVEDALATRPTSKKLVSERSDITPAALSTLAGKNWLNDSVINDFVGHIVDRQRRDAAPGSATSQSVSPSFVALNSNWWNTIHNRSYSVDEGLRKVVRWAKRAKIDGAKLLGVSNLYIPINASAHWTLLTISGVDQTIEHLNSLEGCGPPDDKVFSVARRYLELHLAKDYDPVAWTEVSGRSSGQIGGFDCGAFVCFNALSIARGLLPGAAFGPEDMGVARQRISATLLNSGFSGELDW